MRIPESCSGARPDTDRFSLIRFIDIPASINIFPPAKDTRAQLPVLPLAKVVRSISAGVFRVHSSAVLWVGYNHYIRAEAAQLADKILIPALDKAHVLYNRCA